MRVLNIRTICTKENKTDCREAGTKECRFAGMMKNHRFSPDIIVKYSILCPILSFMGALGFYLIHFVTWSDWILGFTFLLILAVSLLWTWKRECLSCEMLWSMTFVWGCGAAFWDAALFSPWADFSYPVLAILGAVGLNGSFLLLLAGACKRAKEVKKQEWVGTGSRESNRWAKICFLVIMAVFVVLSWETIDDWFRWDSYYYMSQLEYAMEFDFTLRSLNAMNLVNHLCTGYTVPAMFFANLLGNVRLGVRVFNIILAVSAIGAYYGLLRVIFPSRSQGERLIATALLALSPWLLGLVGDISLDYAGFCFLVFVLYFSARRNHIMMAFCGYLLCFSKEPGIVACAGVAAGMFLERWVTSSEGKGIGKRFRQSFFSWDVMVFVLPALLWLMQYLRLSHWGATDSFHYFGFNPDFLERKLVTTAVLNFSWIGWLLAAAGICTYILYSHRNKRIAAEFERMLPVLGGTTAFLIFNFSFVTFNHARYNLLLVPGLFLVGFWTIGMWKNRLLRRITLGIWAVLLMVQTFWSIDPLTAATQRSLSIGQGEISSLNWVGSYNDFGDASVYNRQYTYFDEAFDRALTDAGYDGNGILLLPGCFGKGDGLEPEYIFYGIMGDYAFRFADIYWDTVNNTKTMEPDENSVKMDIRVLTEEFAAENIRDDIYYVSVPWYEDDEEILDQFEVMEEETVSYRGWDVTVMRLRK